MKDVCGLVWRLSTAHGGLKQAAVAKFQTILSGRARAGFIKAWREYSKHSADFEKHEWADHREMSFLTEYIAVNDDEEEKAKLLAIKRIKKLLSFAKVY